MGRERKGTDATFAWLKKEMRDWEKLHRDFSKLSKSIEKRQKYKERQKAYEKQQREIRLQKWENRVNWLANKIDEHNKKKNFGKQNDIIYKCGNCNTEIKETDKFCPMCGSEFVKNNDHTNTSKSFESITNYYCDKCGNEVSKESTRCNNCGAQFVDEKIPTTFMCSNCHNLIKESEKCPRCGAWFIEPKMDNDKKNLLRELDKNIKKDNWLKLTKEELANEIKAIISLMNNNYNNVKKYVSRKSNEFEVKKFIAYQNKIDNLSKKVVSIENKIKQGLNKADSLKEYSKLLDLYSQSIKLHKEMIGGMLAELKVTGHEIRSKNASIISNHNEKAIYNTDYCIHSTNDGVEYEEDYDYDNANTDDIVYNELEDWQKREVDEGNYDPYNFEEEELEEDDYYYEDDKE